MKNSLVLFTGFFTVFLVITSPQETIQSEKEFNMTNNVYKILREHEWDAALQTGEIITDLDNKDGFIHLSTATQLAVTLSFFFQGEKKQVNFSRTNLANQNSLKFKSI